MSHPRGALKVMVVSAGTAMMLTACTTTSDDRSVGAEPVVSGVSEGAVSEAPLGMAAKKTRTYKLLGKYARWNPCRRITYRVNTSGMPRGASKDIHGAFRRMSRATGIRFAYKGTTAGLPLKKGKPPPAAKVWRGSDIVFAFARSHQVRYLGNAAGIGGSYWRSGGPNKSPRERGYVVINRKYKIKAGFGKGPRHGLQGTRGQLYMHEIGHVVGLDHVTVRSQVMYPTMTRKPATFGSGDRRGLRLLGRSQGCVRE